MKRARASLLVATNFVVLVAALVLTAPREAQAPPPPAVPGLPTEPFFASMELTSEPFERVVGTTGGKTLGITSITIENRDPTVNDVFIFHASVSGSTCDGGVLEGGAFPSFTLRLQANEIVHLAYPTPMVFGPLGGLACVGVEVTTEPTFGVDVVLNGFAQ